MKRADVRSLLVRRAHTVCCSIRARRLPDERVESELDRLHALKTYGRFAPNQQERDKSERIATGAAADRAVESQLYQPMYRSLQRPEVAANAKSRTPAYFGEADHSVRTKAITYVGPSRSVISVQGDHAFRSMAITK